MTTEEKIINKNLQYANLVLKSNEGDKKSIFGRPSEFKGGEWVAVDNKPKEVNNVNSIKDKYKDKANIAIRQDKSGNIVLDKIKITDQGTGVGTSFMTDLVDLADIKGSTIALTPSGDFGGNVKRLKEFYKRFGFVENKGKNKDYEISETMYRPINKSEGDSMNKVGESYLSVIDNLTEVRKSVNKICGKVEKADEGDTRMIFGKPYTYTSGDWVQDDSPTSATDDAPDEISDEELKEPIDFDTSEFDAFVKENAKNYYDQSLSKIMEDDYSEEEAQEILDSLSLKEQRDLFEDELMEDYTRQYKIEENTNEWQDPLIESNLPEDSESSSNPMADLRALQEDEQSRKSKGGNMIQKSINIIRKNLAGVHDALVKTGATTYAEDHSHSYQIDRDGNGTTTGMIGEFGTEHIHDIKNYEVKSAQNHIHMI